MTNAITETKISHAGSQFIRTWDKIETTIEFKEEWANGTGYYDHLVGYEIPGLKAGDRFKSVDAYGRKIIGVVTPFGNVVIFQRYSDNPNTIVNNAPKELRNVVLQIAMSCDAIQAIMGFFDFDENLGKALQAAVNLGYAKRAKEELEHQAIPGPVSE